jgi:hypothetical protein
VLLLAAQTVALVHQHAEDTLDNPCVICSLAKAQTAGCDTPSQSTPPPRSSSPLPLPDLPVSLPTVATHFQPRGPPPV